MQILRRSTEEINALYNAGLRATVSTLMGLDDGATVTPLPGRYVYSLSGGLVLDMTGDDTVSHVVRRYSKWFAGWNDQNAFSTTGFTVGTWSHEGLTYVDVSTSTDVLGTAIRAAHYERQLTIWDTQGGDDGKGGTLVVGDYSTLFRKRTTKRMGV